MKAVAISNYPESPGFSEYLFEIKKSSYEKAKKYDFSNSKLLESLLSDAAFKRALGFCFNSNDQRINEMKAKLFIRNMRLHDHLGAAQANIEKAAPIIATVAACWASGGTTLAASVLASVLQGLSRLGLAVLIFNIPKSTEDPVEFIKLASKINNSELQNELMDTRIELAEWKKQNERALAQMKKQLEQNHPNDPKNEVLRGEIAEMEKQIFTSALILEAFKK